MESPVRVILAGCGGMSRVWLRYLTARADVKLVGLVDPVAGRAAEHAREFELPVPCFADIGTALAGCDADLMCDTFNPAWSWYRHGAGASAIFEMTDGLVFTYRGCWYASGHITEWPSSWRIVGERGTLTWDGENAPVIGLKDAGPRQVAATYTGNTGHDGCLDEMFAARAAGRESDTSYTDNIKSLAMCHAAIASARRAARIDITDPFANLS